MTLIAHLHPRGCLTLIADILVVSTAGPAREIPLPTRTYVPPERMRSFERKPVTFYRKVLELSPTVTFLWAGSVNAAKEFATSARDCFQQGGSTEDALVRLIRSWPHPPPNFSAIIATTKYGVFGVGDVYQSRSAFAGEYAVAGSGRRIFSEMMEAFPQNESGEVAADSDALRIAGDLMAREIYTLQPLVDEFGASYEILYHGPTGFERVDDVMHMFVWIKASRDESKPSFTVYAHPVRQWYEGDQLYVFSYSGHETSAQGLKPYLFMIPSILGEATRPSRPLSTLNYEPAYLSVHHVFEVDGRRSNASLNLIGRAIGENFNFVYDGINFHIQGTEHYADRIRARVARLRAQGS